MKKVNSKVILHPLIIKKLEKSSLKALEDTADYVLGQVIENQVVPFGDSYERGGKTHQGGTLQDSGFVDKSQLARGVAKISFSTPYARRMYFHPEYNFRHEDNVNAKGLWLEDWAEGGKNENKVKKFYSHDFRRLGGLK